MERAKKASPEEWRKRVERWKDSGLTAREFAAETGLNFRSLNTWSSRLLREGALAKSPRPQRRTKPRFIEVTQPLPAKEAPMLELVISEVVVRIPTGFDEATLGRVLAVVRQS